MAESHNEEPQNTAEQVVSLATIVKDESAPDTNPKLTQSKKALEQVITLSEDELKLVKGRIESCLTRASKKKQDARLTKAGVVPSIETGNGRTIVFIPRSCDAEDYPAGAALLRLATRLRLEICLLDYKGKLRDPGDEDLASGILFGIGDDKINLLVKSKDLSHFELGRRIVRAQQLVRIFGKAPLVPQLLVKDHFLFGNNPGEKIVVDKTSITIVPKYKTLAALFKEEEWAEYLRTLLIKLIRLSASLIEGDLKTQVIKSHLLSYEEFTTLYCSREITLEPSKGKRRAITKRKVPAMPNPSPLLSKEENSYLRRLLSPIFNVPDFAKNSATWYQHIMQEGGLSTVTYLTTLSTNRANALTQYGQITTARLGEIKKTLESCKGKRKKDINSDDMTSFFAKVGENKKFFSLLLKFDTKKNGITRYLDQIGEYNPETEKEISPPPDVINPPTEQPISKVPKGVDELQREYKQVLSQKLDNIENELRNKDLSLGDLFNPVFITDVDKIDQLFRQHLDEPFMGLKDNDYANLPEWAKVIHQKIVSKNAKKDDFISLAAEVKGLYKTINNLLDKDTDLSKFVKDVFSRRLAKNARRLQKNLETPSGKKQGGPTVK